VTADTAREALTLGAAKLPIKTKIVTRLGAAAEA
jgi:large subunit ribosomal protein L16